MAKKAGMNYLKMAVLVAGIGGIILGNNYFSAQTQSAPLLQCKKFNRTMASNRDEESSLEDPVSVSRGGEGEKKKMTNLKDLINEIGVINKRAWEMALSVHRDPSMRTIVKNEAKELSDRLLVLASELEKVGKGNYPTEAYMISESILDLQYAREYWPIVSLRLGREIEDDKLIKQYAAIDAIAEIGKPAVQPLIQALKEKTTDFDWKKAAEALCEIADSKAVRPLIQGLEDKNDDARNWAAQAIGKIGDARAVQPLIEALKDKNRDIGLAASEALVKIGESAIESLTKALNDEHEEFRQLVKETLDDIRQR